MADSVDKIIQGLQSKSNTNPVDRIIGGLQAASQAGGSLGGVNAPMSFREPPQGIERYAREGVPLDVTTGAGSLMSRAGLSFARTEDDKVAALKQMFNNSEVEPIEGGNFIIRNVLNSQGQPVDLLADEQDVTLRDVADLTKAGLQTVAEAITLKGLGRFTEGMGRMGRVATEATVGGAASAVSGAPMDALNRFLRDQPLQISEIGRNVVGETVTGAALGTLLGGAVELPVAMGEAARGRVASGVLAPGENERFGIQAIQRLNQGVPANEQILPTVGQLAKNPDVMRFEAIMSKMPIIGRLFRAPLEQQEGAIRQTIRRAIGAEPLRPLADIGAETVETLKDAVKRPGVEAKQIETSLIQRATDELDTAIQRMAPAARPFTVEGAAALTKLSVRAQHTAFRNRADELFEEAGNPIISTAAMQPALRRIREELPKRTVINESELIDVAGQPLATTEGREVIRELVPSKLNSLMSGLDQLDPEMPLGELRRIRSMVDSAISDGRGLPEVSTHELTQLRNAITQTIDQGIRQLGDSDAAQRLAAANTFYRENIDRFETPLISQLLKEDPVQPGFIGAYALLDKIKGNPDEYMALDRFMRSQVREGTQAIGPASTQQFNALRRTLVEQLFANARVSPGQTAARIDADKIIAELQSLKPQVRASLLGGEARNINRNLDLLSQLKTGYKDIPEDALRNFLNRPNNSVQDLSKLAVAAKKERDAFQNGLLKKFLKGQESPDALPPDRVIDWLLNSKNPSEVADVMAKLSSNPKLVEDIQRQSLVGFLQKVRSTPTSAEAARLGDPAELMSPKNLIESLKDENQRQVLRNVLGTEAFNFIENFTQAQAILGKKSGAEAGGFVATEALLNLMHTIRHLPSVAKHVVFATVMTNRGIRQAIMEQSLQKPLNTSEFTRALISSTPMVEALSQEFGKTGAELILDSVKTILESTVPDPENPAFPSTTTLPVQ